MKKISVVMVMVALLVMPSLSQAMMEMAVGGWQQNIEGDLSYNPYSTFLPGTIDEVDLKSDLGLDDETRGMGWLKMDLPLLPNIYVGYTPMSFEGTGIKSIPVVFGRYTFNANTALQTKVELNHLDVGLYYSIPFLNLVSLKKLNIDLGLNLRTADLDAEVTGTDLTTGLMRTDSESYTLPIPMLYGAIQITPVEKFSLEAEVRGISLKGNYLLSALARAKARILGPMFISAGYRYDDISLDEKDIKLDSTISGVFVETGIEF